MGENESFAGAEGVLREFGVEVVNLGECGHELANVAIDAWRRVGKGERADGLLS